jgi:hypothetical protein
MHVPSAGAAPTTDRMKGAIDEQMAPLEQVRMQAPGFYRTNPSQAEATRDAIFAEAAQGGFWL